MADNTVLNSGSGGDTLATDDIGGIKYPRSKLVIGADGTNDGDVSSANPMPVTGTLTAVTSITNAVTVNSHAVTNAGTFACQVTTISAGDNNIGNVDIVTVPADPFGVNADAGAADGSISAKLRFIASTGIPISSSALPTGAASAANQATIIASLSSIDGHVDGVEGSLTSIDAKMTACNTGAVVIASSALPTGAATAARQDTGNASLSSIDGKLPAQGQALAAASVPVVLTAAQISTLTPLSTITTVTTVGAVTAITNALPAGTNAIGKLAANSGVDIGDVDVTSISAGSNLIGDVGLQPRTSGGLTMHKTTSAASTNATSLKASAGQVYSIQCFSVNAAVRYLKLYNKASAPTVGTDTPVKTLAIPGNTAGAGFVIAWPQGLAFATGIAFALTTEATDAGTTGVAASEITVNIDYK